MSRDGSPLVRDVSPDEGYTYMHRAFFQAFLTHSVMTVEEIKPVLAHVMTAHNPERPWTAGDVTQPHLTSTIQTINARIEHYDFEIRSMKDQHTKLTVYALVNKTSDSLTQLATKFSASEIAYIRRLLDYMFETNNTHTREVMAIKHTEASQLARIRRARQSQVNGEEAESQAQDAGISIQEADEVLITLQNEGFFQKSPASYYSLAPRALMELRAYLKETYNEPASSPAADDAVIRIRDCEGCREIVTHGVRCNDKDCGVRWHDACANSYYRNRKGGNRKCPKCGTECSGDVYVGERADKVVARSSTGARRSAMHEEAEEEEEEE
ncbi:non-structural maintenance of chromosomes element 1-like protein [Parastagonospora nodorum]|nr:non-structural maintenance of chromosomes element 1-like protein [Parastagonospora nodorum]KAH4000075.1 non-structural maintenance of chromosomes element 1-like protein [Parastagonospora nodorum]KAH4022321.1 non-structural maintenance of chromosomes element 1-like protein [Parastagonospora nodorum]KAH4027672.1 non-structural maintenance of chromosomes element 1-like protein [Parastagonospora nodorum]KAH4103272.1 non-structural maintenance of chromosomes element 1-like protein [Parastagonospo